MTAFVLSLTAPTVPALEGTVLGPYQGAEVCLGSELDLDCDGATASTNAAGAFTIDGDGDWLAAYVDDTTEQIRGASTIPTERPMVFLATAADAAVISARSTAVVAEMAAGLDYAAALARVAARHGLPVADLLADPDSIADPDLRARIEQAELDLRERIRLAVQTASWRSDAADWLPLALIPERQGPLPADCGQSWTDAASGEQHRVYRLTDESATGIHLITRTITGTAGRGRRLRRFSRQRIVSAKAVMCSEVHSTISGRALGDGRFANAEVCMDATGDGGCADEASSYRTQADAQGRFRLTDLPDDLLVEHGLIAEAVTGERLRGSGDMVLVNNGEALLTPTLSVIAQYAERYDIRFGALYRDVLDTLGLDPELNLGVIDYAEPALADDPSAQALADFDAIIIDDPDYAAFMDGTLFPEEWIDWLKQAYAANTANTWPNPVDLGQLELSAGAEARYDGYFDVATLGLAGATAGNDLRDGEHEREGYAMDDLSDTIRALARDGTLDSQTPGAIISVLMARGWPEGSPAAQLERLKNQLYFDAAPGTHSDMEFRRSFMSFETEFGAMAEALLEFAHAGDDSTTRKQRFDTAFALSQQIGDWLMEEQRIGQMSLSLVVQIATARLLLHRERINHKELLAPGQARRDLEQEMLADYKLWRDRLFNGEGGYPSLLFLHVDFLDVGVYSEYGWDESGWPWVYCYGNVRNHWTRWEIGFRGSAYRCDDVSGEFTFSASVANVRNRLRQEFRLRAYKVLAAAVLWPRLLPPEVAQDDAGLSAAEQLGATGYFLPDEMKRLWHGPFATHCLRYTSWEQDNFWRCEYDDLPGSSVSAALRSGLSRRRYADIDWIALNTADQEQAVSWGIQEETSFQRDLVIAPPHSDHSLTELILGFGGRSNLESARFGFLRRDSSSDDSALSYSIEHETVKQAGWDPQPVPPAVAPRITGSLDYRITGLKRLTRDGTPQTTFVELSIFVDGDHRAP